MRCSVGCRAWFVTARTPPFETTCSTKSVQAFSKGAADVGLGLVLLVSAGAIASGRFGVAQLALFTAYLGWLSFLPRMIGRLLARRKQAGVAFERMGLLVADQLPANTVTPRHLPIEPRQLRSPLVSMRPERQPLERLEVRICRLATRPGPDSSRRVS
ncbi:MAG: hypothetical protein R2710_13290 [Acidimicrobiales bacterium]